MHLLSKQKTKPGFTVIVVVLYSAILFLPSASAAYSSSPTSSSSFFSSSSSSSYGPPSIHYIQQVTEPQTTTESDNITIGNTIVFLTPEIRIDYPATWNALPGIPT